VSSKESLARAKPAPQLRYNEEEDPPHPCSEGWVHLGYIAHDEETGEEVKKIEAVPCRRCAQESAR
jgi:hypothetical protein